MARGNTACERAAEEVEAIAEEDRRLCEKQSGFWYRFEEKWVSTEKMELCLLSFSEMTTGERRWDFRRWIVQ